MRLHGTTLEVSATDLSNFLGCRHRTALDMAVAWKQRPRPPKFTDPLLELLYKRGLEHENAYVDSLKEEGSEITDLSGINSLENPEELLAATLDSMRSGAQVIVQGALHDGGWFGKPDVLRRVDRCGDLGGWSYEVIDTKLARTVRKVARELNKQIELVLRGEDTELDKRMVEELTDPLMHIIRNALDHGIESAQERQAAGKPPAGQVTLRTGVADSAW